MDRKWIGSLLSNKPWILGGAPQVALVFNDIGDSWGGPWKALLLPQGALRSIYVQCLWCLLATKKKGDCLTVI